jgi:hypothetical protein
MIRQDKLLEYYKTLRGSSILSLAFGIASGRFEEATYC